MREEYAFTSGGFAVKSLKEIKEVAPSAFATKNDPVVSSKYSRISTVKLIKNLQKFGWFPISARQVGSSNYGRHIIRLTNTQSGIINFKKDDLLPQIILDNSFDGGSPANFDLGLFRKVCSNGLTVKIDDLASNYSFRHLGISEEEVKKVIEQAVENFSVIGEHIKHMNQVTLTDEQKAEFAVKALVERDSQLYKDEDGKVDLEKVKSMNDISQLLEPLRDSDKGEQLWRIFNMIQEKLVIGGYERISTKGRKITVKGIAQPYRNVEFNRGLWTIAESYLN